jgi:hypothetical protein
LPARREGAGGRELAAVLLAMPGGVLLVVGVYELVKDRASPLWAAAGLLLMIFDALLWALLVRREQMIDTPGPEPRWEVPSPYNYSAALDAMGTIAAPLLASVSIALVAVLLTDPKDFHTLNLTILLLVMAAAGFVAAVECSFQARQYAVSPQEIEDWWPDHDVPTRRNRLRQIQREHLARFRDWARRARTAYNLGILALIAGVGALLWPTHLSHTAPLRLALLGVIATSFLVEGLWVVVTLTRENRPRLPPVGPEKLLSS